MLGTLQTQKFKYLFNIIGFDHDGAIKEQDFISLAENIAVFRCMKEGSIIENRVLQRGSLIWEGIKHFLQKEELRFCNINNWLTFLER